MIPKRSLGKTGVEVSCVGLGGEGVLRTFGQQTKAKAVIERALELGINYFESARAYSGSESYYGMCLGARRKDIFLASKSHERSATGAKRHLETSLTNLNTDWLDLWQVHDVRSISDLKQIFAPGGAIETFDWAKRTGLVRFVGITVHQNPAVVLEAMGLYEFDTVLMPVNAAEPAYRSFLSEVLPQAQRRGIGIVGMKVLCRGLGLSVPGYTTVRPWIRYALSHDISTVVIGCDNPQQVEQNLEAAADHPMTPPERAAMESAVHRFARQLMYYK